MTTFFSDIGASITGQATSLADNVSGALSAAIVPAYVTADALMLLFYGIAVVRGEVQQPFMTLFGRVIKVLIILAVVQMYAQFGVVDLALSIQNDLVQILTGAVGTAVTNPFAAVDQAVVPVVSFFAGLLVYAYTLFTTSDVAANVAMGVLIVLFIVLGGGIVALAMFYALLSTLGMLLVLGLGPLFIAGLAFGATTRYFDGWLSSVLGFSLLSAVSSTLLEFIIQAQAQMFAQAFPNFLLMLVLPLLMGMALLLLMAEVPRLIAQLTQGADITGGVVGFAEFRGVYSAPWFGRAAGGRGAGAVAAASAQRAMVG